MIAVRALEIDGVVEIIRAFSTRGGNDYHVIRGVRLDLNLESSVDELWWN